MSLLGFRACAVYDGEEAVLATEAMQPRLVFLDIDMPGLDGYETASCIRQSEDEREVELVALTARDSQSDRVMSASAGFDLHVQKPIGSKLLCQLAEKACKKR